LKIRKFGLFLKIKNEGNIIKTSYFGNLKTKKEK
jgi:hypothetical protein